MNMKKLLSPEVRIALVAIVGIVISEDRKLEGVISLKELIYTQLIWSIICNSIR